MNGSVSIACNEAVGKQDAYTGAVCPHMGRRLSG